MDEMTIDQLRLALGYKNMTLRELATLIVLYNNGEPMRTREIALKLQIPRASMTRAFDGLSLMKLLNRQRDWVDRRDMFGRLTPAGERLAAKLTERK